MGIFEPEIQPHGQRTTHMLAEPLIASAKLLSSQNSMIHNLTNLSFQIRKKEANLK